MNATIAVRLFEFAVINPVTTCGKLAGLLLKLAALLLKLAFVILHGPLLSLTHLIRTALRVYYQSPDGGPEWLAAAGALAYLAVFFYCVMGLFGAHGGSGSIRPPRYVRVLSAVVIVVALLCAPPLRVKLDNTFDLEPHE